MLFKQYEPLRTFFRTNKVKTAKVKNIRTFSFIFTKILKNIEYVKISKT